MKSDASKALRQIQKVIDSLTERKSEIVSDQFAVPLMQIVSIAREHDLSMDLISYAMKQRAPRQPKTVPRKNIRSNASEAVPNEPTMQ